MLGGVDQYTGGTGLAATGLQHVFVDGGAAADVLSGGDIAETLDGGSTDADVVSGGAGDDTLISPARRRRHARRRRGHRHPGRRGHKPL